MFMNALMAFKTAMSYAGVSKAEAALIAAKSLQMSIFNLKFKTKL